MECIQTEPVKKILDKKKADYNQQGSVITIKFNCSKDAIDILTLCRDYINSFEVLSGTMDDVFIAVTGKEIRE